MTRLCVLASGSKGNAIYVRHKDTAILIDAGLSGSDLQRRLHTRGIDPQSLDAVLVSHEHADHILGVGVMSRRFHLPVFVTQPTLKAAGDRLGRLPEVECFQCGAAFHLGSLTIRPFPVSHDAADPVGFSIRADGIKIGIATDLGTGTRLVCHHLQGCRLLVLEANHDLKMLEEGPYPWPIKQRIRGRLGHLSNEDSRDLLEQVAGPGLRHVVLAHISETNNHPKRALSVLGRTAANGDTQFHVARQDQPGDMIVLQG